MKPAPTLYVVTTERVLRPKEQVRYGTYLIKNGCQLVQPTVRFATTCHWMAKLIAWWHGGTIAHDQHSLLEHQVRLEDYT